MNLFRLLLLTECTASNQNSDSSDDPPINLPSKRKILDRDAHGECIPDKSAAADQSARSQLEILKKQAQKLQEDILRLEAEIQQSKQPHFNRNPDAESESHASKSEIDIPHTSDVGEQLDEDNIAGTTSRFRNLASMDEYFNSFKNLLNRIKTKEELLHFINQCALDEKELKSQRLLDLSYLDTVKFGPALREFFCDRFKNSNCKTLAYSIGSNGYASSYDYSHIVFEESPTTSKKMRVMRPSQELLNELGISEQEMEQFELLISQFENPPLFNSDGFLDPVIFFLVKDSMTRFENDVTYAKYYVRGKPVRSGFKVPALIPRLIDILRNMISNPKDFQGTRSMIMEGFILDKLAGKNSVDLCRAIESHIILAAKETYYPNKIAHLLDTTGILMRLRQYIFRGVVQCLKDIFKLGRKEGRDLYKAGDLPVLLLCAFLDFKKVEEYKSKNSSQRIPQFKKQNSKSSSQRIVQPKKYKSTNRHA